MGFNTSASLTLEGPSTDSGTTLSFLILKRNPWNSVILPILSFSLERGFGFCFGLIWFDLVGWVGGVFFCRKHRQYLSDLLKASVLLEWRLNLIWTILPASAVSVAKGSYIINSYRKRCAFILQQTTFMTSEMAFNKIWKEAKSTSLWPTGKSSKSDDFEGQNGEISRHLNCKLNSARGR